MVKNVTVHISLLSVSADRTDVCDSVSSAAAAGVLPHAAGLALRLHGLPGTFWVCRWATVVVEEVCVWCILVCLQLRHAIDKEMGGYDVMELNSLAHCQAQYFCYIPADLISHIRTYCFNLIFLIFSSKRFSCHFWRCFIKKTEEIFWDWRPKHFFMVKWS